MSNPHGERHPFLDDLTDDSELTSSVLRGPIVGAEAIRLVVDTVGTFYTSQTPRFVEAAGARLILEYQAVLTNGEKLDATVVVDRDPNGSASRISVRMSPLGALQSVAAHLRLALSGRLPDALFL